MQGKVEVKKLPPLTRASGWLVQRRPSGKDRQAVDVLAEMLTKKASESATGSEDNVEVRVNFIEHEVRRSLSEYLGSGPWLGRAFTLLSLLSITAGLLSATVASWSSPVTDGQRRFIAILGVVVGVLGAVLQIWKPGQKSVAMNRSGEALYYEGWDYLTRLGRYADDKTSGDKWPLFAGAVGRINRNARATDTTAATQGNPDGNAS